MFIDLYYEILFTESKGEDKEGKMKRWERKKERKKDDNSIKLRMEKRKRKRRQQERWYNDKEHIEKKKVKNAGSWKEKERTKRKTESDERDVIARNVSIVSEKGGLATFSH